MSEKTRLAILCAVIGFATMACEPRQPSDVQAQSDVDAMTFVRHRNGQCFGVVRFTTYAGYQGSSIAAVPSDYCDPKTTRGAR